LQPGSTITVSGTSNVHDWEMTTTSPNSFAEFKMLPDGKPETLQSLSFKLKKNTLKSDKSGLDKRALEALRASKNPEISFQSVAPAQVKQNGEKMLITTRGNLCIAGVTKVVDVKAECTNGNGSTLVCKGETKLKMTDFDVTPPTMMLGTLKTGDEVTISYTIIYK
jgi:polyisoprenoid-binding protein YceI